MKKQDVRISNPEELNKHLQHSSPVTWIILGVSIAILIAFFAWSFMYKIKVKITGIATVTNGVAALTVDPKFTSQLKEGQTVHISNTEGLLSYNDQDEPIVSNLTLDDGEYSFYIVVKEIRPIDFIIK